ncbi:MAG: helix-turn-helix domain-containing protein, partial [Petrotogales bacterium]
GKYRRRVDKSTERAIHDILKSRAESRVYIYLLRKNGAISEDIIKGTKLHPSTVRELLSKMYDQKLIYREKLKNDSVGKNPYFYRATPPIKLLQKYAKEIEARLNKIAELTGKKSGNTKYVRIKIFERVDKA